MNILIPTIWCGCTQTSKSVLTPRARATTVCVCVYFFGGLRCWRGFRAHAHGVVNHGVWGNLFCAVF